MIFTSLLFWPSNKMESWRYIVLNKLAKTDFVSGISLDKEDHKVLQIDAPKIVVINGKFKRELSRPF